MLSLYLAFLIGLQRPYWAMATVYIVSQPLSGALRSKAIYRLIGTLVGGSASILIVPSTADEPLLLSIALARFDGVVLTARAVATSDTQLSADQVALFLALGGGWESNVTPAPLH